MTRQQISTKVEKLGYEYAEQMMDPSWCGDHFFERFGIRLGNEAYSAIPFDQLFDWITAEGQAFPEQLYSWSGEYEWLTSRGDVVWDDEDKCERSCDGFELVEDWNAGITRFLNEHSSRKESPEL